MKMARKRNAEILLFENFMKFWAILIYMCVLVASYAVEQINYVCWNCTGDRRKESYVIQHLELLDSENKYLFMWDPRFL
jgi:hypothetical protein